MTRIFSLAAYRNGHDHRGGYAEAGGIHFVTFQGVVESGAAGAFGVVEVFPDRSRIRGYGTVPSRNLALKGRQRPANARVTH